LDILGELMSTIQLYREQPKTYEREILGPLTEDQLDFLMENLDEEFDEDMEYFLDQHTLEYLKDQRADNSLLSLLEKALSGYQDGVDILYVVE
jgi:hypothetical protein